MYEESRFVPSGALLLLLSFLGAGNRSSRFRVLIDFAFRDLGEIGVGLLFFGQGGIQRWATGGRSARQPASIFVTNFRVVQF